MKLLFLVVIFTMTLQLNGQNTTILASASDSILLPGEVYGLVGRQHSTKFTWVIVEDDDVQYSRGRAVFHGNDNTVSYFRIDGTDTIFALPNMHYGKLGQVITDRRGNKLECIVIEPYDENCACDEGSGGLTFRQDSVTKNTLPTYKMFLYTQDVEWMSAGARTVPTVSGHMVDTLDSSEEFHYVLAIQTTDGIFCDLLELNRDFLPGVNKVIVYTPSMREFGKQFTKETDGTHRYKGKKIEAFLVMKEYKDDGGVKKLKHRKRRRF